MPSKFKQLFNKYAQFFRFVIVGFTNTAIDLSIYFCLANLLHFSPVLANIVSTSASLTVSFFLNYHFVFKSTRKKLHTAPIFIGVSLFTGWGVQSTIIQLVINLFHNVPFFIDSIWLLNLFAKCCAIAVGLLINFFCYRIIFKPKSDK